ncbi:hypothetical protein JCM11251_007840 [Rhodosporidiobolus azoricus]
MKNLFLLTTLASASLLPSAFAAPVVEDTPPHAPETLPYPVVNDWEVDAAAFSSIEERDATLAARDLLARQNSPNVVTYCKNPNQFALTFDDGPYQYGADIAKTLQNNGAKGTFFVNGYNWGCIYDRADDLIARYKAGHVIASHTWSHPDIARLSDSQLNKQLDLVETALRKILGVKPRFFRAPYGSVSSANLRVLKNRGYSVIGWNHDSFDAGSNDGNPVKSVAAYKALSASGGKSYIALNHETKQGTARTIIPQIVPELKKKGFRLVSMSECLNLSPYQSVGTPGKRDSSWTCSGTPAPGQA